MTMTNPHNIYDDLPIISTNQEVRILELFAGSKGSKISGKLIPHSLLSTEAEQAYDALSYMWGAEKSQDTIQLNGDDNFEVRPNLYKALQILRLPNDNRRLWIDAICINQDDLKERSGQVQLMRKVYQQAREVVVWLDAEIDPHCPAMLKVLSLDSNNKVQDLGPDPSIYQPFNHIFRNPYWMRVWIQQEISNASTLKIQCREHCLPVLNMYHFVRLMHEQTSSISLYTPIWFEWADVRPNIRLPSRFGSSDPFALLLRGSTFHEEDQSLFHILENSFKLQCTDERDRLFGLLFLSSDYNSDDILVNYALELRYAYSAFPKFIVKKYNSLDFILHAGINWKDPTKEKEMPTWTPDWRGPGQRMALCPFPKLTKIPSSLSLISESMFSNDDTILHVHGMCIDRVSQIFIFPEGLELHSTTSLNFLSMCKEILEKVITLQHQVEPQDRDLLASPLWKNLACTLAAIDVFKPLDPVANATIREGVIESAMRLVEVAHLTNKDGNPVRIADILQQGSPDKGQLFAQLAWGVIGKHMPFLGERGKIGMCLKSAEAGDEVWVLLGCQTPVLLRREKEEYEVVGEVYYEGANRGEYLEGIPGDLKVGDFLHGYEVQALNLC